MDGQMAPARYAAQITPLPESSKIPCCAPKIFDLPQDESGCSAISSKGERMSDTWSGAVLDESVAPGLFNDGGAENKPRTTIKRIIIPTLLVV
jgi:hypothetical protein